MLTTHAQRLASLPPPPPSLAAEYDRFIGNVYKGAARLKDADLLEASHAIARKLGLEAQPLIYVAPAFTAKDGGNAVTQLMGAPAMMHANLCPGAVLMNERALEVLSRSPGKQDLLAAIGHEMGHLKQGYRYLNNLQRYPLLVGPIAAVAGMHLLERMGEKAHTGTPKEKRDALEHAASSLSTEHVSERDAQGVGASIHTWQESILRAGKYLAAAALGLAAGAMVVRHGMRAVEFQADRAGAIAVGSVEPMISVLKKVTTDCMENGHKLIKHLPKEGEEYYKMLWDIHITHAHPSLEERVAHLRSIAHEVASGKALHALGR